ncbi:MAG: hypothetical protein LBR26_09535 [Prevotella sp.]|jgi:hypothetical protein|nr:hypothetical protein [Prevotella sp.]
MAKDSTIYSSQVMEIADYMFSHPNVALSSIASDFSKKYNRTTRTVWRYIKYAKEHNVSRIKKRERAKDKVLVDIAKEETKKNILNREEVLEILSGIVRGRARLIHETGDVVIPTESERIKAAQQLSKMLGFGSVIDDVNL